MMRVGMALLVAWLGIFADDRLRADDAPLAETARQVKWLIAHRGSSLDRPENTHAAIERAIEAGATGVELDVRTTSDGHLVIMHDATVDRTTDGQGKVNDRTLAELEQLDAGGWFAPEYAGQRVLTFGQALELCRGRVDVLVDLKEQGEEYADRVTAAIRAHGEPQRAILGLRSVEQARLFRRRMPEARQLGFIPNVEAIDNFLDARVEMIRLWPRWIEANPELATQIRRRGGKLHLNASTGVPDEIRPLLAFQPDSLLCDDPGRLLATLKAFQAPAEGR